ncbi:MAG TPA: VOC family protein [Solirubrobacteraceae bacterium]
MTSQLKRIHDLAHIGHVELLTSRPEQTLAFFHGVLGMEVSAREGQSVFLRGWGDYQRYCLKLTEADAPGLGHVAFRAFGQQELDARVNALKRSDRGGGWIDGDIGHGPAYRFTDPDGHPMELYYETEHYVAPEHLRPALRNQPQRYTGRGAAVKRLDHINLLTSDVEASRRFAQEYLGFRLYELNVLDDGTEVGAWMSLTIAAHELIYVADNAGGRGRFHHAAFWVDTREEVLRAADIFVDYDVPIEAAPSKHAAAQGFFLYGFEPGGNRVEVTSGGYFVYAPDAAVMVRTEAEMAEGMSWGVQLPASFNHYGTPPTPDDSVSRQYDLRDYEGPNRTVPLAIDRPPRTRSKVD